MALKQPIDGTVINSVPDMLFKREMNQLDGNNVALGGTFQKWREKDGFFVLGEVCVPSTARTDRFEALRAKALIERADFRDKRTRNAELSGNGLGWSWLKHSGVNDQPAFAEPNRSGGCWAT